MISRELTEEIDRYVDDLRRGSLLTRARRGEVSRATVVRYLTGVRYLLRHTPEHLALGKKRAEEVGNGPLASYFERKLAEEVGHDRWADNDLAVVGADSQVPASTAPPTAVVDLMKHVREAIEREPILYVAYILFAEYFTVKIGPEWVASLENHCGIPAGSMTAVTNHIELDKAHVAEGCRDIDELVRDERLHEPLLEVLRGSMQHFSAFCDDLCDVAA